MPVDNHIRTAKAIQCWRVNHLVNTTKRKPEEARTHNTNIMPPPAPRIRPPNSRYRTGHGVETVGAPSRFEPCDENMRPSHVSANMGNIGLQCPPYVDRFSVNATRQGESPEPIWAPARFPDRPPRSPSPSSSDSLPPLSPPRSPAPSMPTPSSTQFQNLSLYSPGSPPPANLPPSRPGPVMRPQLKSIRKKPEKETLRPGPHSSTSTARPRDSQAENPTGAGDKVDTTDREISEMLKEVLRRPDPAGIFDKNFNFGPKRRGNGTGYVKSRSPRSENYALPSHSNQEAIQPLKRPRYDSSNGDAVVNSLCDRLHSASSPIPIRQPQARPLRIQQGFEARVVTPDVHPGQLVDFTAPTPRDEVHNTRNVVHDRVLGQSSHNARVDNQNNVASQSTSGTRQHVPSSTSAQHPIRSAIHIDPETEAIFTRRQRQIEAQQEEARRRRVRDRTIGIQRQQRTRRGRAPVASNTASRMISTTTAESSALPRATQDGRRRERSYVARCESAEAFLRAIRASFEARRRKESVLRRGDTPYPSEMEFADLILEDPL